MNRRRTKDRTPLVWLASHGVRSLLLPLLLCVAVACQPVDAPEQVLEAATEVEPPFWRVRTDGGESYLLGTVHAVVDARELPEHIWTYVEGSALTVLEADLLNVDAEALDAAMRLPYSRRASDYMSADDWELVVHFLGELLEEEELDRLRHWVLYSLFTSTLTEPVEEVIDLTVQAVSESNGVPLGYLETWQEQIDAFNRVAVDEMVDMLVTAVHDPGEARRSLLALADAYRVGDCAALGAGLVHPELATKYPTFVDELVTKRNQRWLPQIRRELDDGGAFIAVGAGHLVGDAGLVRALEELGYDVEYQPEPPETSALP
jgi:uncharacterized protein YbaP (TraB family)